VPCRRRVRAMALVSLLLLGLVGCLSSGQAAAQARTEDDVLLTADELEHDETTGMVTARGSVELVQGDRMLLADAISYNEAQNTVIATGAVSLVEPSGEVIFSDYVELRDDLKNGFLRNLRILLSDGSRFAANQAERRDGNAKIMSQAVFSPCNLCKEDPESAPFWQIKARKVIHDEVRRNIEYEDATLEIFGVPVIYTPYLLHPDPTVERRTGLLAPTMGHSDELGTIFGQPFFYTMGHSRDLEVEPIIFSKEGVVLRGRYRERMPKGYLDLAGTLAYVDQSNGGVQTDDPGLEGSADLAGRFSLNDTWRAGFDYEQSSARTYLKRYRLDEREALTSRVFAEGFRQRSYAAVNAYKFQGLNAGDDRARSPIIAPMMEYNFIGEPDSGGARWEADANLMSLSRQSGADSRRLATRVGWVLPYVAPEGDVYTLTAQLRGDVYQTGDLTLDSGEVIHDELTARVVPQIGLDWRYPWVRRTGSGSQVIEPIVNLVAASNGGNPQEISNEDSQAFEFDDTNLFAMNRYEGIDRLTDGARVDYGVRIGLFSDDGGFSNILIGQSYRFWGGSSFDEGTGLDDSVSDLVGRVQMSPAKGIDLLYRFRLDKDDLKPQRSELGARISNSSMTVNADYVILDEQVSTAAFGSREQLDLTVHARLNENWGANLRLVQDLSEDTNRTRKAGIGLVYSNECVSIGMEYERTDLEDADIEPEDRIFVRLNFKYLGAVESF
jgi:LPS-assembly protein